MAAGKIFAISFAIGAVMNASFGTAMNRSSLAMQQLSDNTRFLNAEQQRLERAWQASQGQVKAYAREIDRIRQQYDAGKISQSQYQSAMERAQQGMRTAGMSADEYRSHLARLRQEMAQTKASADQLRNAQAAKAAAGENFANAKAGFGNAVAMAGMVAAPIYGVVETAAKFEAAMSKVQAITRANTDEIGRLTAEARRLGETTQFTAQQSAEAMSYLGMAGWNTEQIIAGMPGLLALAAAGGTDLARTADIVSDDLTAFGLAADQASHMADVFAVTATRTNTNVEMIGETMKYAAPVARAYGATMEETAALTGIMANAGVKASQAGTALRAGFMRLAGPPKKASKAMQELGISLSDVSAQHQEASAALASLGINMDNIAGEGSHKMVAVLQELRTKMQGLTSEEKLAYMQMIFGTEAATGWLNVLDAGPEVFNDLVSQMEHCDGEAEKMAAVMMDNAKGAIVQLQSAVEGAAISIGTLFLPTVADVAKWGAEAAATVSAWVKEHEGLTKGAVEAAAAIAALVVAVKGFQLASAVYSYATASMRLYWLMTRNTVIGQRILTAATWAQARAMTAANAMTGASIKGLQTAILSVGRASMAAMFSPLGIALMALAAAAYLIYANWDKVGPFFMQLWGRIQTTFSNAWTAMQPTIERLKTAFYTLVDTLAPKIAAIGAAFMAAFAQVSAAFAEHSGTFDTIISIGMMVAEIFGSVIIAAIITFANIAVGFITTTIGIIVDIINGLVGVLTGIITFITGVFAGDWTTAWTGIVEIFSSIFGTLANVAGRILGGIKNTVTGIIKDVKDFVSSGGGGGGGQEIAANARGGIYRKGAFLTTFAEDSAEAAIPLDGSPRAIGLWRKAGEILGVGKDAGDISLSIVGRGGGEPAMSVPPISITLNFNGDTAPEKVKQAVMDAGRQVQRTFAEQMENYRRERGRVSFG